MTPSPPPSIGSRILDVIFGEKGTPEEIERAKAAGPPKPVERAFDIVIGGLFVVWLFWAVVRWGWLPIDRDSLPTWGNLVFGGTLLIAQIVRDQVERYYKRRADRARNHHA
jgi:hypothetical protein